MFNSDHLIQMVANFTAPASFIRLVAWAAMTAALTTPVQVAEAVTDAVADSSERSQGGLNACKVNGQLVAPIIAPGKSYAWIFVANFDQPQSKTTVAGCLATRTSAGLNYVPGNYCTVMNNTANRQFGGGIANFDGNAYLQCAITNGAEPTPPDFWIHARASFPATLKGDSYSLISSNPLAFTVDTDAACLLKLNSRYDVMTFAHSTIKQCSSFVDVESRLNQSVSPRQGTHSVSRTNSYGPTPVQGTFGLPANFSFTLGAPGDVFSMDWLVIDPGGSCCNPN